jgi:ribosomal-protein-alanine N-acetyltransferase
MTEDDVPAVKRLEIECNLSPWSVRDYQRELIRTDSVALVAKKDEETVAFLAARLITISDSQNELENPNEIEIYNIAVEPELQNRGIGQALLDHLLTRSSALPISKVWLEVRESNDVAIRFYKKNGFEPVYIRNKFYSSPAENAIVMELNISSFD